MRKWWVVALCAALGGCVTNAETVQFRASNPQQQALMRDGQPAFGLASEELARPCASGFAAGPCQRTARLRRRDQ